MRILLLPNSYASPSSRFRVWQFAGPLRELGHDVAVRVIRPERGFAPSGRLASYCVSAARVCDAIWNLHRANEYDVVFMNRDIVPEIRVRFLEPWLAKRNPKLIFDFDDAIFVGPRLPKLVKILPLFAHITAGNEYLAAFARQQNPNVSIWPTVVDTDVYRPPAARTPGPVRIGWTGSASTAKQCLPLVRELMCGLAAREEFEFVTVAEVPLKLDWPGVRRRHIRWTPATEVDSVQLIDIGLMPLNDSPFERGKCALKAIQYMAVGAPAVVSPVGVNGDVVRDGETGFHCRTDSEWEARLRELIHDPQLRAHLGGAARERVVARYSIASLLPAIERTFGAVAAAS